MNLAASGEEQRSWRCDGAGNRILTTRGNATTMSFHNALNQTVRAGGADRTPIEGVVSETATVKVNSLFPWTAFHGLNSSATKAFVWARLARCGGRRVWWFTKRVSLRY